MLTSQCASPASRERPRWHIQLSLSSRFEAWSASAATPRKSSVLAQWWQAKSSCLEVQRLLFQVTAWRHCTVRHRVCMERRCFALVRWVEHYNFMAGRTAAAHCGSFAVPPGPGSAWQGPGASSLHSPHKKVLSGPSAAGQAMWLGRHPAHHVPRMHALPQTLYGRSLPARLSSEPGTLGLPSNACMEEDWKGRKQRTK